MEFGTNFFAKVFPFKKFGTILFAYASHFKEHSQILLMFQLFEKSTFCPLRNFACFLSSANFFSKSTFSKNSFSLRTTIIMSNSLDPDQARHFFRADLGPNCLQRLSADNTSR